MFERSMRKARAGARIALLPIVVAVFALAGCTAINDQGVVVSQGPVGDLWDVQWNQSLGTASMMRNRSLQDVVVSRGTPPLAGPDAEAAVREVLRLNPRWFPMRSDEDGLTVVENRAADWMRVVRFQQTYEGIPVAGAGCEAHVFPNGRVGSIEGRFEPDIHVVSTPAVNEELAASRARSLLVNGALPSDLPMLRYDIERGIHGDRALVIVPRQGGYALAWAIVVENGPRERWRVYIDADTGEPIGRQPISATWMR